MIHKEIHFACYLCIRETLRQRVAGAMAPPTSTPADVHPDSSAAAAAAAASTNSDVQLTINNSPALTTIPGVIVIDCGLKGDSSADGDDAAGAGVDDAATGGGGGAAAEKEEDLKPTKTKTVLMSTAVTKATAVFGYANTYAS